MAGFAAERWGRRRLCVVAWRRGVRPGEGQGGGAASEAGGWRYAALSSGMPHLPMVSRIGVL